MQNLEQIKGTLDEIISQAEKEALEAGVNILSLEFQEVVFKLKQKLLDESGITLEELEEWDRLQKQSKSETSKKVREMLALQIKGLEQQLLEKIKEVENRK